MSISTAIVVGRIPAWECFIRSEHCARGVRRSAELPQSRGRSPRFLTLRRKPVLSEIRATALKWWGTGALLLMLFASSASALTTASTMPLLHPMFQHHAVLQRDAPIRIYGQASPNEHVTVSLAGNKVRTKANADGSWEASLPALPAGGPHQLSASTTNDQVQHANDVLIGDVWLCSGQSNMVLQVHRALDSRAEIAGSTNDSIRLLNVGETGSPVALHSFATPVQWLKAEPAHTPNFSAACFYFARELQKTVPVPMGLISAAWGGSRIQAWTSAAALRGTGEFDQELAVLQQYALDPVAAVAAWAGIWQAWWQGAAGVASKDQPWNTTNRGTAGWQTAPTALGAWERWGVPELADFNGMLWYRTELRLSRQQATQDAVLKLGAADEVDMSWVNGIGVGSGYGADLPREYRLPRGTLHAGKNHIVVNVLDTYRDGGLVGPAAARALKFADGTSIPLSGPWLYRRVPSQTGTPPRAPWHTAAGLSNLYNGMIAPIGRYGLRGILWYQGESNTFEATRYGELLRTLTTDWRSRFGADLPFLNVQLANFGKAPTQTGESDWAQLREAQRKFALTDGNGGLAIAIDIGDRYDIHPPNKQELGRRLARLARHAIYGEQSLPPSGPVPLSVSREGEAIVVRFTDVSDGLLAYGADGPIGFELCGAAAGSCRYAQAQIRGDAVVLRAALDTPASRVRYGWADSPVVTLFDGAGLPAGPFELPVP